MFLDQIKLIVRAGNGGDGCVSFRREKNVPKGGPDGGDGGDGGNIIVEVEPSLSSLTHLCQITFFKAGNGQHGMGKKLHGKNGDNVIIKVPQGTLVYEGDKSKRLLADLIAANDQLTVANGGKGGRGNPHFRSSINRAPRKRELGEKSEPRTLHLELHLIADVGFVGYPNAGKSTLLAAISNAKPRIASYPFTTLKPNLGVRYINHQKVTFADIPGIIEGAHEGKGLGLNFLRHIERTLLLIFVLDITANPLVQYKSLEAEIREYDPLILKKPSIVALNKIDITKESIPIKEAVYMSALRGIGIDTLLLKLQEKLFNIRK